MAANSIRFGRDRVGPGGALFALGDPFHPQQPHRHRRKALRRQGSVKSGFIALNGEAGYQPDVLRGGLHYLMPIQYVVHIAPLVTIPQGKIGYIFARDGEPLSPMQTLASNVQPMISRMWRLS